MGRRPNLFIIGAAKCGTTSIYAWLRGHPQIYMSPRKEPRFFAPDLLSGPAGKNLRYPEDLERYLALFAGATDEPRVGEASPRYIYSRQAPRLIHDFEPEAFIVALVRNPVDMMVSLHAHHVAGGTEPITDFGRALEAESERRTGATAAPGRRLRATSNPRLTLYRERARFGAQLQEWFSVFGPERVHVIVFEEMVANPSAVFRQLLGFLRVDPDYQPPAFAAYNPRHRARSTRLRGALMSRSGQYVLWRLLPALAGERGTRALLRPFRGLNRRPAERAGPSPALRRRLQLELADDVALLSELVGRDLAALWWPAQPVRADERLAPSSEAAR